MVKKQLKSLRTLFVNIVVVVVLLLQPLSIGLSSSLTEQERLNQFVQKEEDNTPKFDVDSAIVALKTEGLFFNRDIDRLDSLSYNIINDLLADSIANKFKLSKSELVTCIQTIAISEGSIVTKRGSRAFRSSLFIAGNNPFGIKGKGNRVTTVEYFNGKRYVLKQNFQKYASFEDAIKGLMHILMLKRYDVVNSKNNVDFFYALKRGGYFTAPNYHRTFFIPYSNKLKKLHVIKKVC